MSTELDTDVSTIDEELEELGGTFTHERLLRLRYKRSLVKRKLNNSHYYMQNVYSDEELSTTLEV